jgi:hypothetical protein
MLARLSPLLVTQSNHILHVASIMCRYENEELLRHMWPTDVWFHVDDLSSAHVSGYMLLLT